MYVNSDKYERILDAAVKVFARKGFFQSRVSDVAREASVADGTIYLYFKNKDDLMISIFEVKMREMFMRLRDAVMEMDDARGQLRCLIETHLAEFQANPDLAAVFQVELRQTRRFMRGYKKGELKRYLDFIGQIVERGQREGAIRNDLPLGLVKRFVFGTLDEVVTTWVLGGNRYNLKTLVEPVFDLFLRGIGG